MRVKVTERSALVQVVASGQQITAHSGLVFVRELAARLGVGELLDRVAVKRRRRGYRPSQVILGLCETLIAGGECLDDIALLRGDSAQQLLRGHGLPEPTTLGRFLRRFSLGHLGQLNRALDEVFARVHPLLERETVTLDLDATYIELHGPVGSRQGTRGTYKGKVCWHPLLCFVGETGEWLHAKLRNGHAGASTGATRFLDECLRRLPTGARLFLRADEGFWGQNFFAELERRADHLCRRGAPDRLAARPDQRDLRARLAAREATTTAARSRASAGGRRPGNRSGASSSAATPSRRASSSRSKVASGTTGRSSATTANAAATSSSAGTAPKPTSRTRIKEAKLGLGLDNLPCQSFHANWAYLLCTLLAFNLLAWLKLLALPERERSSYVKRLRFRFIAVAGTVGRSGRQLVLRLSAGYPLLRDFVATLERIRGLARAPA